MNTNGGENHSRKLSDGTEAHLIRHDKNGKWQIRMLERIYGTTGNPIVGDYVLWTGLVYAEDAGWKELEFDSFDDAYSFIEEKLPILQPPAAQVGR